MYVYILVICITPQEGLTALMMAVKEGHITVINTLVESRADINIQENVSATERSCGVLFYCTSLRPSTMDIFHLPFVYNTL